MMEIKTYCYRCGKEVTLNRTIYLSNTIKRDSYNLCNSCYNEFCSWLKGKKSEQALAYADQDTLMPAT